MDKIMLKTNFFLFICTFIIVHTHARALEASKITLAKARDYKSIKLKLEREFRLLEKWSKSGVPLADARKRSSTLNRIIVDIVDRNKKDPINPGECLT